MLYALSHGAPLRKTATKESAQLWIHVLRNLTSLPRSGGVVSKQAALCKATRSQLCSFSSFPPFGRRKGSRPCYRPTLVRARAPPPNVHSSLVTGRAAGPGPCLRGHVVCHALVSGPATCCYTVAMSAGVAECRKCVTCRNTTTHGQSHSLRYTDAIVKERRRTVLVMVKRWQRCTLDVDVELQLAEN